MTQLHLRPTSLIERVKVRVLSRLLHLANADVGRGGYMHESWVKARFYANIKKPILLRYAVAEDVMDIQRIVRDCRGCGGTGIWGSHRRDGGSTCYRCNGTGVYRTDHYGLARYRLGGRLFHQSVREWIGSMPGGAAVTIEGRIEHPWHGTKATEALMWLALAYDLPLFRYLLCGPNFITDRFVFWPLVAIQTTLRLWVSLTRRIRRAL